MTEEKDHTDTGIVITFVAITLILFLTMFGVITL